MASSKLWFSLSSKTSNFIYPFRLARTASSSSEAHPWPEWVTFVECVKSNGYFSNSFPDSDHPISYTDSKILKEPCLSFARHRFHLLRALSSPDIQTLVEKGCPNLSRKAVNSAKRLRAHLHLQEAEVCGACDLRGSCDRSYLVLTRDEASVRTVDVVRILLLYALDPSALSGGTASSDRIAIETSVRRLLSELVELCDPMPAPDITSTTMPLRTKIDPTPQYNREPLSFDDGDNYENVEMRKGDWMCSRCNFMNFGRNIRCLKCQGYCPKKIDSPVKMKKGDWNCPECDFMNFASKSNCFRCKESRPARKLEPGEWECSSCSYMNFARNSTCKKCSSYPPRGEDALFEEEPPARKLEYGEWECTSCAYVNFRKNITCRKCNCVRPPSGAALY